MNRYDMSETTPTFPNDHTQFRNSPDGFLRLTSERYLYLTYSLSLLPTFMKMLESNVSRSEENFFQKLM